MIELIILIIPGIIAAILHCKLNNCMTIKKAAICFIPYAIGINLILYGALWLIGMRNFSLFDMTMRFKIKWFALGIILGILLVLTYKNMRNLDYKIFKHMLKRLLPSTLLLIITYAIFAPTSLFLENIDEFLFSYIHVVPIILCIAILLYISLTLTALCLTNEQSVIYYIAILFSLSLGAYIQRNFLNADLSSLDGAEIEWSFYSTTGNISICIWILCFIIMIGITLRYKEKFERIIGYAAYFLSAVQLISMIVLIITIRLPEDANHGFSKEDEFTIGSEENIVIFLVDTLQSAAIEEYISSDAYIQGNLDDFTFFDHAVSGGSPTKYAVPLILTGQEYEPMQSFDEYASGLWQSDTLYDYLNDNGYDVRFFSLINYIPKLTEGIVKNYTVTSYNYISDYYEFTKQLYKLSNFYLMPQFLKHKFLLSTNDITDTITSTDDSYTTNNIQFYQDMLDARQLQTNYSKTFRLYHLWGVHPLYNMNENIEKVEDNTVTEQQQLQGVMKIINTYIDEMKRLGVYDISTIVILGDHGRHEKNNTGSNPALLIKLPNESHELEHNSVPIHFRNFVATLAQIVMEDYSAYGPSFYDITDKSDVERLHTINRGVRDRNHVDDAWDNSYGSCRLIVPYELDDLDKYQVWDPYKLNRITYTLGDVIDYTSQNTCADSINYRLYKENGAATASNELSICFELSDYRKGDLDFHYTYSKVYNDEQNIKIYANGSRVGTVTCTSDNAGIDNVLTIPKNRINDNELVIRMVFPNAVTPNQLDRSDPDTRVLSVGFTSMWLE